MEIDHKKRITDLISNNKVFLFMKGNAKQPMCRFSSHVVKMLKELGTEFESFDVLEDPQMREAIKDFSDWPTLPQLFINGKFIGGADITTELYESGDLAQMLK